MRKFGKILLIGLGFGLVSAVLGFLTSEPAPAQHPPRVEPVKVTNTPLPVQVTNTVPVSGSVNINSLPNVNATITNSSLSALITNPTTNPVLVSNVNDSVSQEFFNGVCEVDVPGSPFCNQFPTVVVRNQTFGVFSIPTLTSDGRKVTQAVIEFVSGVCSAGAGDDVYQVSLNTTGPTGLPNFVVPVKTLTTAQGVMFYSFSQVIKAYASPGAQIALGVQSASGIGGGSPSQQCSGFFSGILQTQ